ncbi:MAG TPA: methyltransferase domain-containing protein [Candidatus Acidoferrum sp.]|nr:methyltransferase domain-containing protein [Candidatus Acidoferrum sp.]
MDGAQQGQVSRSAADVYEEFFVPAVFREPAQHIVRAAGIGRGQSVLDVACGTGVLAREAASATGSGGQVTGLDRNDGMLAVARRLAPGITWQLGLAESLPFADESFDRVLSQFGLMFFEDRTGALRQMRRVLKPGGRMHVAVWDALDRSPGYAAMLKLLRRLFGAQAADALRAPFVLGEPKRLHETFAKAGLADGRLETFDVTARFPSLDAWMHTEIRGWTLADMIDEAQYQTLLAAARKELAVFQRSDGSVAFSTPAHLMTIAG